MVRFRRKEYLMSMELLVVFALSKTPSFERWEAELASSRSAVQFAEKIDLQKHSGFAPMSVQGRASGVYFLREDYAELAAKYKALASLSIENPSVYSLGYGGQFDECASAFYSAAALVRTTGGYALEPQGNNLMTEPELTAAAQSCLEMANGQ
jgi:hypothetical protein